MSLRLDYREAIRTALVNKQRRVAGYTRSGAPVFTVCGFDEADDDAPKGEDDSTDEDTKESNDEEPPKDDDKGTADSYKAKMQAADRRASALQKEVERLAAEAKQRTDAELSELEKAKRDLGDTVTERDELKNQLSQMRLENAFLSVNTVTWHDPELALAQIDLGSVDVDDNGKVDTKQLKSAIKELATKKPYLVKTSNDSSTEASGSNLNGKRKGDQDKPTRDTLSSRFPALGRS